MSAFISLLQKRRKLKELFPMILNAKTADEQEDLFTCTKNIINKHMTDEEKSFYKMLGPKNSLLKDKINVAKREHDEIRRYLAVLERNHKSYEEWICTLGELKHALSCHLKIEEEILALAKKTMEKLEFSRLINRMKLAEQKIFKDLFDMWALEAP